MKFLKLIKICGNWKFLKLIKICICALPPNILTLPNTSNFPPVETKKGKC